MASSSLSIWALGIADFKVGLLGILLIFYMLNLLKLGFHDINNGMISA